MRLLSGLSVLGVPAAAPAAVLRPSSKDRLSGGQLFSLAVETCSSAGGFKDIPPPPPPPPNRSSLERSGMLGKLGRTTSSFTIGRVSVPINFSYSELKSCWAVQDSGRPSSLTWKSICFFPYPRFLRAQV